MPGTLILYLRRALVGLWLSVGGPLFFDLVSALMECVCDHSRLLGRPQHFHFILQGVGIAKLHDNAIPFDAIPFGLHNNRWIRFLHFAILPVRSSKRNGPLVLALAGGKE